MSSEQLTRILVYLQRRSGLYPAAFSRCIFKELGIENDELLENNVHCQLLNNRLILELPSPENQSPLNKTKSYLIKHPPYCPVNHLSDEESDMIPEDVKSRGVDVGVVVLVESADERVLMTRRSPHMRTFPGVWVPPGGHVEDGETIEEAGLRELTEETGLCLPQSVRDKCEVLGLWESVFPPLFSMGSPRRHHIVIYLHLKVDKLLEDLQSALKLNPKEVDACIWLNEDLIQIMVHGTDSPPDCKLPITLVNVEGDHISGEVDAAMLKDKIPAAGVDVDRISTGSRYALSLWLKQLQNSRNGGKSNL